MMLRIRNVIAWLRGRFLRSPTGQTKPWPPVFLTEELATRTAQLVGSFGDDDDPHEGIVYWAGVASDSVWVVTTVLVPRARTTPGSYQTSSVANAEVVALAASHGLHILAQLHGHPSDWVGHSGGDNTGAFMAYQGFYSIVLPHYGRRGMLPLTRCGTHQFVDGQFVQLSDEEMFKRFQLVPTAADFRRAK